MRWIVFIISTLSMMFCVSGVVMQKDIKSAFYMILLVALSSFAASLYCVSKESSGETSLRIVLGSMAFFLSVFNFLHYATYL